MRHSNFFASVAVAATAAAAVLQVVAAATNMSVVFMWPNQTESGKKMILCKLSTGINMPLTKFYNSLPVTSL